MNVRGNLKAYVLKDINKLVYEEIPKPNVDISKGEVLIKVKAAGVCGSDIPRIFTQGTYHYPTIIGHEFAGKVVEAKDDELLGKRVGVFPLIPCMKCSQCKARRYEMCSDYSYIGSRCDGAFAEYVKVPETNIIPIPENVSYEAAAMMEPMAVAVHAIRQIKPRRDETVAVCGMGTIGMLVTMFLLEMGIKDVIVFANKEHQRKKAVELGVDPANLGLKDRPIDVFFECVGTNETINWALNLTAPGGRVMLVGNPASDVELDKNTYWKILRKQLTLKGTWNSSYAMDGFQQFGSPDDWHYVLERLSNGRIDPTKLITHRLPLEELKTGLYIMKDKSEDYIKVMGVFK